MSGIMGNLLGSNPIKRQLLEASPRRITKNLRPLNTVGPGTSIIDHSRLPCDPGTVLPPRR